MEVEQMKNQFYVSKADLIESGAIRLVYEGAVTSIYSLADRIYGVVFFTSYVNDRDFLLMVINQEDIKKIVRNEKNVMKILNIREKEPDSIMPFGQKQDEIIRNWHQEKMATGKISIDLEEEKKILGKYNKGKR